MVLSTSVDATYADDGSDASVKQHQQDHDTVHGAVNALAGGTTGQVWQKTGSADYAASWVTPGYGGGDYFRSGYYSHGVFAGTTSSLSLSTGRLYLRPFPVPVTRAFDRIGITVATAGTAGATIRLGIYNPGPGMPGSLLVDAGTVASDTTGGKEVVISQTLAAGVWWLAVLAPSIACAVLSYPNGTFTPYVSDSTAPTSGTSSVNWSQGAVGTTFPSTLTGLGVQPYFPAVELRAA